jgi:hypothetical protein
VGDVFDVVDEVVVIDPVNAGLDEAEEIDEEEREDGVEAADVGDVFGGDVEFEHHDGDDDSDDSVGEGFEAAWGERFGHGWLWEEAYNVLRGRRGASRGAGRVVVGLLGDNSGVSGA